MIFVTKIKIEKRYGVGSARVRTLSHEKNERRGQNVLLQRTEMNVENETFF